MAELEIVYFYDHENTRRITLEDASDEPELARALAGVKGDGAKADAILAWFVKNPRKMRSVAVEFAGDEARVRRIATGLPAPELRLCSLGIRGDWIAELGPHLESLDVLDIAAFATDALAKLPKLRSFAARHSRACDLSFLSQLPTLTELVLRDFNDLTLPTLPRVTRLYLGNVRVAAGGLAGLTGLRELDADGARLDSPGALPALERVNLGCLQEALTTEFFRDVPALKSITANLLNLPDPVVSLSLLAAAPALEEIDLSMRAVTGLGTLTKLPRLAAVSLYSVEPAEIDIGKLPAIQKVKATGAMAVKGIERATQLRELELGTAVDLAPLVACAGLERLVIFEPAKGLSLKPLAGLEKLSWLDLGYDTRVTAKQIEPIGARTGLTVTTKLGDRDAAELYAQLSGKVKVWKQQDYVRPAVALTAAKGDPGSGPSRSFGTPFLATGERWPTCGNCNRSMPCLLQLDLAALEGWDGLLQVFFCTSTAPKHCEVECETWAGSGRSMLLRIVEPAASQREMKEAAPRWPEDLPRSNPQTISFGKAAKDVPGSDDAQALGVWDAPKVPMQGDKLGGWPHWLQGPEWPSCPDCSKQMTLLVQVASEKAVAHQWGDLGYAYVFACAEHRERLGFCWQAG